MASLGKFYAVHDRIETVACFIKGTSPFSLRLVDWFVTNYCKKHKVFIDMKRSHTDVFTSYRSQLKAFSKNMFDPFRRNQRIMFHGVETTIGQLNFFRWVFEQGVLSYVLENKHDIEEDMNQMHHHRGRTSASAVLLPRASAILAEPGPRRKRRSQLSEARFKTLTQRTGSVTLNFS
jgi:hypothetical protein